MQDQRLSNNKLTNLVQQCLGRMTETVLSDPVAFLVAPLVGESLGLW